MEVLLIYLLKSAGLMSIFYLCYMVLLRNDTSFSLNRKYLLGGIAASAVLPSLYFTKKVYIDTPQQIFYSQSETLPAALTPESATSLNLWEIAGIIYLVVCGILLIRFLVQIIRVIHLIRAHDHRKEGKHIFIETCHDHGPFSFFNYIIYNPKLHNPEERELIFKHEQVHSSQFHSLDVLISNLACCILWFNPLSWLYKKSIIQNLEFIADRETVAATNSKKQYFKALIRISIGELHPALTNSFYQSFIKKRIIMLNKSSHQVNNMWKLHLVFPAVLAFMFTFNVQTEFYAQERTSTVISNTEVHIDIDKNTTRDKLDGYIKLMDKHNVILKFDDVQYNSEGLLTNIKVEFIDRSNISTGTITKSNPSGIEAFRYVFNQKEGSRFTIPKSHAAVITSSGTKNVTVQSYSSSQKDSAKVMVRTIASTPGKEPVFIVDGKVVKLSAAEIDADNMNSITVLKGASAVSLYGKEVKEGAVIMTTKKHPDSASYAYTFTTDTLMHINAYQNVQRPAKVSGANTTVKINSDQYFYISSQDSTRKPLYIVDGKDMGKDYKPYAQNTHSIKSVQVTKGDEAVKKYGARGSDGVIEIFTKSNPNINTGSFAVLKNTMTQNEITALTNKLREDYDLDVTFDNIQRNKQGEITAIKVSAKNKKEVVNHTVNETGGINDIYIGLVDNKIKVISKPGN